MIGRGRRRAQPQQDSVSHEEQRQDADQPVDVEVDQAGVDMSEMAQRTDGAVNEDETAVPAPRSAGSTQPRVVPDAPESPAAPWSGEPEPLVEAGTDDETYWQVWAGPVGSTVMPVLESLRSTNPRITSALAMTTSGLAICASGLDQDEATRIARLAASSYALGSSAASRSAGHGEDPAHGDTLALTHGNELGMVVAVKDLIVGALLLWVTAEDTNLGVLTFQARAAAAEITSQLGNESR